MPLYSTVSKDDRGHGLRARSAGGCAHAAWVTTSTTNNDLQNGIDFARQYRTAVHRARDQPKRNRTERDHHIATYRAHGQVSRYLPCQVNTRNIDTSSSLSASGSSHFAQATGPAVALGEPAVQPVAERGNREQQQRALISAAQQARRRSARSARSGTGR